MTGIEGLRIKLADASAEKIRDSESIISRKIVCIGSGHSWIAVIQFLLMYQAASNQLLSVTLQELAHSQPFVSLR